MSYTSSVTADASLNLQAAQLQNKGTKQTGAEFETMVLSNLLRPMFEGLDTDGMFGGGSGEEMFRSFYIDAVASQIVRSGGVGIADQVQSQLLALQESR
ncbi:MAG: rod-binding protein [Asticcacaulis sp.]